MTSALLLAAGTVRWPAAWMFVVIWTVCTTAVSVDMLIRDPALFQSRMKGGPAVESKPLQRWIQTINLGLMLGLIVLAGLDRRFAWSQAPAWVEIAGLILLSLGYWLMHRVLRTNAFAAAIVATSPGQTVVDTGPYAVVRHPMYAAAPILIAGVGLALGSYVSLVILPPLVAVLALRLRDEERLLEGELPGYLEYERRVRWRLVPGLW